MVTMGYGILVRVKDLKVFGDIFKQYRIMVTDYMN